MKPSQTHHFSTPQLTLYLALTFLGIFYILSLTSAIVSSRKTPENTRFAFFLTPFDRFRTLDFLRSASHSKSTNQNLLQFISVLHRNDPEVIISTLGLNKNFITQDNETEDRYKSVLTLDPKNSSYHKENFSYLVKIGMMEKLHANSFRTESELINFTVKQLMNGRVIGWMQGAFEWGPRALGNRSILADARNPKMKDVVNSKVKFRELFRPFAPSVLADRAEEIFEVPKRFLKEQPFGYMLFVVPVKKSKQKLVPAITHVNGTARPQFVSKGTNPLYYKLINAFYKKTGIPLILNTSFNLKGEPIVTSPQDAFDTFKRSHIDHLVMGNFVLDRKTIEEDAF